MRSRLGRLIAASVWLVPSLSLASRSLVVSPGDDLQAAIEDLCAGGEGGTLFLVAGDYEVTETLLVRCDDVVIEGAGMDATRLVWTGGDHPSPTCPVTPGTRIGVPLIAVFPFDSLRGGADPCTIPEGFPDVIDRVELRDLAVLRPTPTPDGMAPAVGIGAIWTRNVRLTRVASSGFRFGISIEWSDDWVVEDSRIEAGQASVRVNTFGGPPLAVKPHHHGGVLRGNDLGPSQNGINITNTIGATVEDNTVRITDVGFFLLGGRDHVVQHNRLRWSAGVVPGRAWLTNVGHVQGAAIHHNVACDFAIGLRLSNPVPTVVAQGWAGPPTAINFHHNQLFRVARDHLVVDPAFVGTFRIDKNQEEDAVCPFE